MSNNEISRLRVVLEASTERFQRELHRVRNLTRSVTEEIRSETESIRNPINLTDDGSNDRSLRNTMSLMQRLKQLTTSWKVSRGMLVPTEEFTAIQRNIEDTNAELTRFRIQLSLMEGMGIGEESEEWQTVNNQILGATTQLGIFESVAKAMEEEGTAYTRGFTLLGELLRGVGKIGIKGFGGIFNLLKKISSHIGGKLLSSIQRTSGAFAALIQKFASGIPVLNTFIGRQNSVTSGFSGGLGSILKYSLGIKLLTTLFRKLKSAAVTGFENLAQYSSSTNESLSLLMSSLTQLKNSIAAAFAPVLNVVAPILDTLIQKVISLFNAIGQVTGALTGNGTYIKAKKLQQDYAKSLGSNAANANKAKKANEELKRTILSFDQINKMDDNTNSSSDGIADTGGVSPADMFETATISSKMKAIADLIKDAWKNADFTSIGAMVGNKLNDALNRIPWEQIKTTLNKIAKSIATFLNGFIETVDWNLVGNTVAQAINTILEAVNTFVVNFHWDSLGQAFGNGLNGALSGLDWDLIQETVHNIVSGLMSFLNNFISTADWGAIGETIGTYWNTKLEIFRTIVNEFDWIGTGQALSTAVNSIINTVDFAGIGETFSNGLKGLLDFGIAALEGIEWYKLGEKVYEGLAAIDWSGIADRVFELIGAGFGGLAAFLGGFISKKVQEAKEYFSQSIEDMGGDVVNGIFYGIGKALRAVGVWIKEHIFDPFIRGFKEAFGIHSPSTVMAEQGKYIIEGVLQGIKDNIHNLLDYLSTLPQKAFDAIGDIKDKIITKGSDIVDGMTEGITSSWDSLTSFLSDIPNKIANAIPSLYNTGANIIADFANGINSIHIPLPHIGVRSWNEHRIGPVHFSTPNFGVDWYAKGGFPDMGELFVANEAGPEMVGKMGNKNTVANNNQIVEGIKAGVFEAVLDAFNASGLLDRDESEKEVVLEFTLKADSETVYKIVRKGKKRYDHRFVVAEEI